MGLIDDFVSGVSREVSKVQTRGQEMMQGFNLQSQLRELERKKTAKLLEIGRLVCDKYTRNVEVDEDVLKDKANEVAGYDDELTILQNELDSLKTVNDPATPASKRSEQKAGWTPTPGFECPACHAPASRDKGFCPSCGEKLKKSGDDDVVDVEPTDSNGS